MLSLTYLSSAKCEQAYDSTRQTSTEVQGTCIVRFRVGIRTTSDLRSPSARFSADEVRE